jgi:methyltransferase-like protein 23
MHIQHFVIENSLIKLFLPGIEVVQQKYLSQKQNNGVPVFPYWAQVWPAAIGLAQFLLQHTHYISNKNLLEIAAGLGLPSIACAPLAKSILCTDYDEQAVHCIQASVQLNGLQNIQCAVINWNKLPANLQPDVLLLSDINYEPSAFQILHLLINDFLQKNTTVILSTPQRLMAKSFIEPLLVYAVEQVEVMVLQADKKIPVSIYVLQKNS